MCTPEYLSDTYLNRLLPSICQMLKQDPADPNNLKETVVNILVLGYYNLQLKFSSQVNFNIKEDLSFILNEKSSFSVETVISQPLFYHVHDDIENENLWNSYRISNLFGGFLRCFSGQIGQFAESVI